MLFSEKLAALEQRVASAKDAVQAAAGESRAQLKQRLDQAQVDAERVAKNAPQHAHEVADTASGKWAQLRADVAAKTEEIKSTIDKRNQQLDVKAAAMEAARAEDEAAQALDFADWAVVNAYLAVLDAIDARVNADALAETADA
ncbi:MAG TPA: hypothetical protein VLR26_07925 [Frankiaceae bacterium]|jgi:hypothetical protein|nr:hypothetical protein [Frankiaceae bacterium]